jgi:hypothetical protein
MTVALLSKSLASVAAVGLMAAWMMPPTTPKPIAPSPLAGLAPIKPMGLAAETAADKARAAIPPPALAFNALPDEASARTSDTQATLVPVSYEDRTAEPPVQDTANSHPTVAPRNDNRDDGRVRYRQGYNWARANDVEEVQDCPPSSGDPAEQGCLDYASRQTQPEDDGEY